MEQNVGQAVVGNYESVPLRCIKPFDRSDNLEHFDAGLVGSIRDAFDRTLELWKIGTLRIPHLGTPLLVLVAFFAARPALRTWKIALFMFAPVAKRAENTICCPRR